MKPLIILDAGHGGVINGAYQTKGKRSPIWPNGTQLFEGVFNRSIVAGIAKKLEALKIPYHILVPEQADVSLATRVQRANDIALDRPDLDCVLISVHGNAGGGTGFELFTYFGQTESDAIAEHIAVAFKDVYPRWKLRADLSDSDSDKEANFYLLRRTTMPAVLTENGFMDNQNDCQNIMMTVDGQINIINYHVQGIKNYVTSKQD